MNVIYNIINAVRPLWNKPKVKAACLDEIDDAVISEHSNGNIFFQFARYYTRADIDNELEEVAKYNFS